MEEKQMEEREVKQQSGTKEEIKKEDDIANGFCDYITKYLASKGFFYEKEQKIIEQFFSVLHTKQLVLLWGKPGSGKTSLPMMVAEAVGADFTRIQVQSNWMDNQDALGFYNVMTNRYVPTQLMEALVRASRMRDRLHIILLDEMNLSNVEYYFSELLNFFTYEGEYQLRLYPDSEKAHIESLYQVREELPVEKRIEVETTMKLMEEFPPTFIVPENVRFVGTLNSDSTTKIISPKVMDRSCLIELQSFKGKEEKNTSYSQNFISIVEFRVKKQELPKSLEKSLEGLFPLFEKLSIFPSKRFFSYVKEWEGIKNSKISLDEMLLSKLLPYIDLSNEEENRLALESLRDELDKKGYTLSKTKVDRIIANEKKLHRFMYWEN